MGLIEVTQGIKGSKAEVLSLLRSKETSFHVQPLVYFFAKDWHRNPAAQMERIFSELGHGTELVAVRSSAACEDGAKQSQAGAFLSMLAVPMEAAHLSESITQVVKSMPGDSLDQVIVQKLAQDMEMSGVVLTHGIDDGSPYYVINYDDHSGRTDTITGGSVVAKSVLIHHSAEEWQLESDRLKHVWRGVRELERLFGAVPLDIEFGLSRDGVLHIFQVRQISRASSWELGTQDQVDSELKTLANDVAELNFSNPPYWGASTVLANMADWNPAEMIGQIARPLAASLYHRLITKSVWREARTLMGYRGLPTGELMVTLAGHPYIDVRASLNSFLPEGLDAELGEKLVNLQLDRLRANPDLHDKIEFDVTPTILTFSAESDLVSWYGQSLTEKERSAYIDALHPITEKALDLSPDGSLSWAESRIAELEARQSDRSASGGAELAQVVALLDEATNLGTLPFAILARHGFIAEAFLRSAMDRGALSFSRTQSFRKSIRTIAGEMTDHAHDLWRNDLTEKAFLRRYGHLRPSAYDITSLRYDQRKGLFSTQTAPPKGKRVQFIPNPQEISDLQALLNEIGLSRIPAERIFEYARRAIAGREFGKFIFTRNLSDALELMAAWGEGRGLSRDDLSFLSLDTILDSKSHYDSRASIALARENWARSRRLRLSYIIRHLDDLIVVPYQRAKANFIGDHQVEARVVHLDAHSTEPAQVQGKIVCIESADPGFDWIFSQGVVGLITRFGGVNSHMAIRCAEFGIPAAIGCGELTFRKAIEATVVDLNCHERKIGIVR
ncbi:MAG: hypothetical protein A2516_09860 [Alphaproteobacteria bacterium RIFOXYD12_FULL_60_8]|nr:MAG: hypothetical protein A2516_09860 [Alphaproteobacteria bacterium RIFOXYD12_FULL_60_8]